MDIVTGALGSVVSQVGELLKEEYDQQTGVGEKMTCLSRDLNRMHQALRIVADVPPEQLQESVKHWAHDVRELSYDIEDVLDRFLVRVDARDARDPNWFMRPVNGIGELFSKFKARHEIAGMVKRINEETKKMAEQYQRYRAADIVARPAPSSSTTDALRLAAIHKPVTQLVGIEGPRDQLISWLSGDVKMKTVSILGAGGLGKTTVARVVHDKLKDGFQCAAFVSVGQNPKFEKVFRNILIALDKVYMKSRYNLLDQSGLIAHLKTYLGSKRYFIVIDDLWETASWEIIKFAFIESGSGSRLIITTRIQEVAEHIGNNIYKLTPLPPDESKKLFYMSISSDEGRCTDNQPDKVSDKILKKCGGIPLAIIVMASLLKKKSKEIWLELCHSIGFPDAVKILSLSYYHLPPHLRTCLLYLSAFPEDYIIEKTSLIWKWVAEGFVEKKEGTGFFEVGEQYFNELINRSLIQSVQSEENGLVYGCRVHDMVLHLLRKISEKENFVTISNNDEGSVPKKSAESSRVRRLAHQNRILEPTEHHMDLGHLRSLIASSCNYKGLSLPSFEILRVLALENCKLMTGCIPLEHLMSLVHLRYLGLTGMDISDLPEEIGALKFLQVLDLTDTSIKKLPPTIGLLSQLICLCARNAMVPDGVIEKLTSLEELHICGPMRQFVTVLDKLSELRVLKASISGSHGVPDRSDFMNSICKLNKLKHLDLVGIGRESENWGTGVLSRHVRHLVLPSWPILRILPACICYLDLPNLTHLELNVCPIEGRYLQILGGLPELCHLKLKTGATAANVTTVTVASTAAHCFFRKLRYCMLPYSIVQFVLNEDSSVSFTMWNGTADVAFGSNMRDRIRPAVMVMPNLVEILFYIRVQHMIDRNCSCDNLGLEHLPSLQKVRVVFMTENTNRDGRMRVKDALNNAMEVHRNKPTVHFSYISTHPR